MAIEKDYYDLPIGKETDWGGDASTGGKKVKLNRVQEFIKGELEKKFEKEEAEKILKTLQEALDKLDELNNIGLVESNGMLCQEFETLEDE